MEITEDQVRHARVRAMAYLQMRDDIPEDTASPTGRCDRLRYHAMAEAVRDTLADLGIDLGIEVG